jgi:signal peptidase I
MELDYDFSFWLLVGTVVSGALYGGYAAYIKSQQREYPPEGSEPKTVEYARSFFPVFLVVLLLRSFLFEPFRIPSGSMIPTLLVGDFILVNKFTYGIRLPVINKKIISINQPQRGDIVVFRYPKDPSTDFIKRVIGVPGDRISYFNKRLTVNGLPVSEQLLGRFSGDGQNASMTGAEIYRENLTGVDHDILILPNAPSLEDVYVVPEGHYFMMGDDRDNSHDSRYWGFVPEENLVGKAFLIWMNFDAQSAHFIDFKRLGTILN